MRRFVRMYSFLILVSLFVLVGCKKEERALVAVSQQVVVEFGTRDTVQSVSFEMTFTKEMVEDIRRYILYPGRQELVIETKDRTFYIYGDGAAKFKRDLDKYFGVRDDKR